METNEHRLVMALRALNSAMAASNRAVAARLDLNESDLAVLDLLHRDGPQTPTSLARRTHMSRTTMTSVLRRLTRDGWVERRPRPNDLRSFTIHATSIDRLTAEFANVNHEFAALISNWPQEHVETLLDFLQHAAAAVTTNANEEHPAQDYA